MENEEQPVPELTKEERIERHFTTPNHHWNEYTFKIYTSVTESGLFEDVEVPLDAFSFATDLLWKGRNSPLSVVSALMGTFNEQKDPPFTDERKRFILDQLIWYYKETVFTGPDKKDIKLDMIKSLLIKEIDKLPKVKEEKITDFNWLATQKYIDTLPDTSAKIKHLIERRAAYKQSFDGLSEWGVSYAEQCQIEINKLNDLAELEQQRQAAKSPFKLSSKNGAKTNLIRVLSALYELGLIELGNGHLPTKELFMQQIGGFMGADMKRYEQALSTALDQPLETNLKVFEELEQAIQKQVIARQENGRK